MLVHKIAREFGLDNNIKLIGLRFYYGVTNFNSCRLLKVKALLVQYYQSLTKNYLVFYNILNKTVAEYH